MNIQDKINDLQKQLDTLQAEFAAQGNEWPQEGDEYWWINIDGEIDSFRWDNDETDIDQAKYGNIYRSKAEAEKERDRCALVVRLKKLNGDWVADWFNGAQNKWYLEYNCAKCKWEKDASQWLQKAGVIYLSKPAAEAALALGDEVLECLK